MSFKRTWMIGALALLPLAGGRVLAQTEQAPTRPPTPPKEQPSQKRVGQPGAPVAEPPQKESAALSAKDRKFADKAATTNMAEIRISQLAVDKASAPDVKNYAQMIVDDHSKANEQLKTIADQQKFSLPTDLTSSQKREYERLSKLEGAKFDKEYLRTMAKDHDEAVQTFQRASTEVTDPQLRSFAENTLPTLREHDQRAKQEMKSQTKPMK